MLEMEVQLQKEMKVSSSCGSVCNVLNKGIRADVHIKGLILNIPPLILLLILSYTRKSDQNFKLSRHVSTWFMFSVCYLIYFIEAYCSDTCAFIYKKKKLMKMSDYINTIKSSTPKITQCVRCFHYGSQTNSFNGRGNFGSENLQKYILQPEVVLKHTDSFRISFDYIEDLTDFPYISSHEISQIKCTKEWAPTANSLPIFKNTFYYIILFFKM